MDKGNINNICLMYSRRLKSAAMKALRPLLLAAGLLCAGLAFAQAAPGTALPQVGFSIVKSGSLKVREGLVYSGGSFTTEVDTVFSAILVKHGDEYLLFDTGLGERIAAQYEQDMPRLQRLLFKRPEPSVSAKSQLAAAGVPPVAKIILSHSHWDHASGITDFPGTPVLVAQEELDVIRKPSGAIGAPWPSQVGDAGIRWQAIPFEARPYEGFERSFDLYRDGKVVLVAMGGHTPGSVGLFLTVDSGKRYFFVGDVVWSAGALKDGSPKFWLARRRVDHDVDATQRAIERIRTAMKNIPGLTVVPAHDGPVQNALGYFPAWVR